MKLTATRAVTNADRPIEPTPAAATALRDKREPNSMSTSALAKGNAGISHNKLSMLPPHPADRVHVQGLEAPIDLQHQCQAHGYFSRRHGQNEQKHNLAIGLMPSRPGHHEGQTSGVEHHLKQHQAENKITAYDQAGQAQQ